MQRKRRTGAATILLMTSLAMVLFSCALAQETPMQWFNRMDLNKDGKLSRQEVPSPRFKEFDSDGDGFVTLQEYKAHLNRAALKRLDSDRDGKISQSEFNALYQQADRYFATRQREAQPPNGRKLPSPLPVKEDPLGLRFTQAYLPGSHDARGRLITATEANHLAGHNRQLFASFGATYSRPPKPDPDFQGFAILRKESVDGPWLVDLDLGPKPYRIEAMMALTFTTDDKGRRLEQPVNRLVAARWSPRRSVLVRNDLSGRWGESSVAAGPDLPGNAVFTVRSFGSHVDRRTGVHHAFAGAWEGDATRIGEYRSSIYRGVYDPKSPTGVAWAPEPELTGVGRIMAFAEANGELYAAAVILNENPGSGGIFRRVDGSTPKWELVYRWKEYDLTVWDDEQRMIRGLTAVPDPNNPGKQVLIGFRYFPEPIIERIDPQRGHTATVELNLREFFGKAFFGEGKYQGVIRAAYNPITTFTHPKTGRVIHLVGMQIYHPGFPEQPHNGSHYLVRHVDGRYDWGPVYDPTHPVPKGSSLDATREIIVSPFSEDNGKALYFAGYDGPFVGNRSAWIYRAAFNDVFEQGDNKR